jgi:hypothetical protein
MQGCGSGADNPDNTVNLHDRDYNDDELGDPADTGAYGSDTIHDNIEPADTNI